MDQPSIMIWWQNVVIIDVATRSYSFWFLQIVNEDPRIHMKIWIKGVCMQWEQISKLTWAMILCLGHSCIHQVICLTCCLTGEDRVSSIIVQRGNQVCGLVNPFCIHRQSIYNCATTTVSKTCLYQELDLLPGTRLCTRFPLLKTPS